MTDAERSGHQYYPLIKDAIWVLSRDSIRDLQEFMLARSTVKTYAIPTSWSLFQQQRFSEFQVYLSGIKVFSATQEQLERIQAKAHDLQVLFFSNQEPHSDETR